MKKNICLFIVAVLGMASCENKTGQPESATVDLVDQSDYDEIYENFQASELNLSDSTVNSADTVVLSNENLERSITKDETGCITPTKISDLIGGSDIEIYKFDDTKNAEAKIFGFTGSIGKKEMLFIQEFRRYGKFPCLGEARTYGVGLRCYIKVKHIKGKAAFEKLSAVAAHAELGNLSATYSLKSIGFPMSGEMLADGLNSNGDYDVDNFGKLAATFSKVLRTLKDDNKMTIEPVILIEP